MCYVYSVASVILVCEHFPSAHRATRLVVVEMRTQHAQVPSARGTDHLQWKNGPRTG